MKKKAFLIVGILTIISVIALTACGGSCWGPINVNTDEKTTEQSPAAASDKGILSDFNATDFDGNEISSEIFKGKKLTMVNIWATFCSPCIREMPELGELSHENSEKGVQIIGIPADITDSKGNVSEALFNTAKDIVKKTNADFTHIVPSPSLIKAKIGKVSSVPETIFVDENGKQIGKSYIGARSKSEWQKIIDNLLKEVE